MFRTSVSYDQNTTGQSISVYNNIGGVRQHFDLANAKTIEEALFILREAVDRLSLYAADFHNIESLAGNRNIFMV